MWGGPTLLGVQSGEWLSFHLGLWGLCDMDILRDYHERLE